MSHTTAFLPMTCRKCEAVDPMVYFAPVVAASGERATCVCLPCAKARQWLDRDDNLREGVAL